MIEVSHLTKAYGPRVAVDDLSFSVKKGEIVGFLGPNGAGKTTTMKILTGFMPATSGEAKVCGYDVLDDPIEVKRNVGYLPETPPVYLEMTVRDYVEYAARLRGVPKSEAASAAATAIEKTAIGDVRERLIGNLSKGYRQRVGLAQAIVHDPQLLILDEPTVGLDPKQIIEIRELIKSLRGNHTVILSSHILPEVTATCDRIIVINKGKVVAEDTIDRLTGDLRRGRSFRLDCQTPHEEGIQAIRSIAGVNEIKTDGSSLKIEIANDAADIRAQILETAVTQKMGALEFAAESVSLEDIFVELTQSK